MYLLGELSSKVDPHCSKASGWWRSYFHLAFGQGARSFRAGVNARSRGAGQGKPNRRQGGSACLGRHGGEAGLERVRQLGADGRRLMVAGRWPGTIDRPVSLFRGGPVAVGWIVAVVGGLVAAAILSVHSVLQEADSTTRVVNPSHAPEIVVAIVSLGTMIGVATKAVLSGLAEFIRSRGESEADRIRAHAALLRAEAEMEMERARRGLPPLGSDSVSTGGTDPAG